MGVGTYLIFLLLGVLAGVATGVLPGFHVNNVAIIALVIQTTFNVEPTALAVMLIANMITHTFLDFIPSTFIGAPGEDTALSTLPMHRMLLRGEGYRAIYLSTYGSALAVLFSLPLLIPLFLLLLYFHSSLTYWTPVILIAIVLGMMYMESEKGISKVLWALLSFLLAGTLGILVFNLPLSWDPGNLGIFRGTLLFPLFSGLFGIPVLLLSRDAKIPSQKIERVRLRVRDYKSALFGTLAGALVGLLPGVSSGVAAVMARLSVGEEDVESFIVSLGSVNTANYIFNLLVLFVLLRPRSGAVSAIGEMIHIDLWLSLTNVPSLFLLFLLTAVLAAILSIPITLWIAELIARHSDFLSRGYRNLSRGILLFILSLIFLFTGPLGLLVAFAGTVIGLIPPKVGVMRVHLMGAIILPVLLFYL